MSWLIFAGGIFALGFFIFHIFFWQLFEWKDELTKVSGINRGVMQVLNLCLMCCFLIFSFISIFHSNEMITTSIGRTLGWGIVVLWVTRAIEQPLFFEFKSALSRFFFVLFLVGASFYAIPLIYA